MKRFWFILFLGLFIRLVLAFSTFHPDIRLLDIGGQFVATGQILNLYDYLSQLPPEHFLTKAYPVDLLIYPPAIFFLHGLFNFIFTPFIGQEFISIFWVDYPKVLGNMLLNFHLLLTKITYLFFDLPAAFLLSSLFESRKDKLLAFTFWILNPVNLYTTYMMGQFDITATFFVILALYIIKKGIKKFSLSTISLAAISLGMGAVFKIYPLYLLIPLASIEEKWSSRIKVVLFGILPYLISIAPYLPSYGFRHSALLAGHTLKSFYAQIPISGGESIMLFPALVIFFYLLFLSKRIDRDLLWQRFAIILLLFLVFTHYHPQWFLWITPFFIIELVKFSFKSIVPVLLSFLSFTALLFFFDPSLTVGIFSPIMPSLVALPSIWDLLHFNLDYNLSRSLLQTVFAGSAIYFIYHYTVKANL